MWINLHKASLNFLRRVTKKGFSAKDKGEWWQNIHVVPNPCCSLFCGYKRTNCMQLFSTWRQFIMTLSSWKIHKNIINEYKKTWLLCYEVLKTGQTSFTEGRFEWHEAKKEAMKCFHDLKHKINMLNVRPGLTQCSALGWPHLKCPPI